MYRIIFFTKNGLYTGQKIRAYYEKNGQDVSLIAGSASVLSQAEAEDLQVTVIAEHVKHYVQTYFEKSDTECFVFIGATGIAVRMVAPVLKSKWTDPAVIVVDELGKFVIPLLSGHTGGANGYALALAGGIKGQAVVTTASDLERIPAFDVWAREKQLVLLQKEKFAKLAAAHLEHRSIGILLEEGSPKEEFGLEQYFADCGWVHIFLRSEIEKWELMEHKLFVGSRKDAEVVSDYWFCPQRLVLGIGCKKGCSFETIYQVLKEALLSAGFSENAIECICEIHSIDLKRAEPGIKKLSEYLSVPFLCHSTDTLQKVQGCTSSSDFVKEVTGVSCVCESAALFGAGGETLLLPKYAKTGVTIALAVKVMGNVSRTGERLG